MTWPVLWAGMLTLCTLGWSDLDRPPVQWTRMSTMCTVGWSEPLYGGLDGGQYIVTLACTLGLNVDLVNFGLEGSGSVNYIYLRSKISKSPIIGGKVCAHNFV